MSILRCGRLAAIAVESQSTPPTGVVFLRTIATALERHLFTDADCAVHWVAVVDEPNPFGAPVRRWDHDDCMLQFGMTDGNSEGMLLYVHGQSDRYRPGQLDPLLRIKVLCGADRAAQELLAVRRWFNSAAFFELLQDERSWSDFAGLAVGAQFFDPECGEHFEKTTPTRARCLGSGDALAGGEDEFLPTDRVQRVRREEAQEATE